MGKNGSLLYYPIFLRIKGKKCVVLGGGKVAFRKTGTLLECGAEVTVVSPDLSPDFERLVNEKAIYYLPREYRPGDLQDAFLAIAATDKGEVNLKIAEEGGKEGILVNVADSQEHSDFTVPSFFRQGDLTIAISTSGTSPALARKIKTRLKNHFGEEFSLLLSLVDEVRSALKNEGIGVDPDIWQKSLDLDQLLDLLRAGQREKAKAILMAILQNSGGRRK